MRIYVASSWRNMMQEGVVHTLRAAGYEVYDFKNPVPGDNGFHWSEIGGGWKAWTLEEYKAALQHPVAKSGFGRDMDALNESDVCVLVLPCGRSAHLEAGYTLGAGKPLLILLSEDGFEAELMYRMVDNPEHVCTSLNEVLKQLEYLSRLLQDKGFEQ